MADINVKLSQPFRVGDFIQWNGFDRDTPSDMKVVKFKIHRIAHQEGPLRMTQLYRKQGDYLFGDEAKLVVDNEGF